MSKLLNIRCDNCGSEYRVSSRGEMNCRFCGSKVYLSDSDFKGFLKTRDEMLQKDKFNNDAVNSDGDILGFYSSGGSIKNFVQKNGRVIDKYISAIYDRPGRTVYIGKDVVVIVFDSKDVADIFINNLGKIRYPSADIKGLYKYTPHVYFAGELEDGTFAVFLDKAENIYPLEWFSEGLKPQTTAWIISRFENIGCLLEFSEIDMQDLSIEDAFINPKTHEMFLLDNWHNIIPASREKKYLKGMRELIKGIHCTSATPKLYEEFLNSEPASNAYEDFERWDNVIMNGFSGHNFHKFDLLDI